MYWLRQSFLTIFHCKPVKSSCQKRYKCVLDALGCTLSYLLYTSQEKKTNEMSFPVEVLLLIRLPYSSVLVCHWVMGKYNTCQHPEVCHTWSWISRPKWADTSEASGSLLQNSFQNSGTFTKTFFSNFSSYIIFVQTVCCFFHKEDKKLKDYFGHRRHTRVNKHQC